MVQCSVRKLYKFRRIHGKLDIIEEYEEDSEVFKDKNYQQKERVKKPILIVVYYFYPLWYHFLFRIIT